MKKLAFIIIAILFAWATFAQNQFTVPERTAEQQHPRVTWIMHYDLNVALSYVKSTGKTVEEYAKYSGNLYKLTWQKEEGFEGFVKGTLLNLTDLSGKVEILNQSDKKVTIKATGFYKYLQDKGTIYNVTYKDYIQFFEVSHKQIAKYLNSTISMKVIDDGVEVIIGKKQHQVTMGAFTPNFSQPQVVKGWVKQINYQTFKGKEENGKIIKKDPLKLSESHNHDERYKSSFLFNKNGNLIRTLINNDEENNIWTRLIDYEDEKIDKIFFLKNSIPTSKGERFYEKNGNTSLNFYDLETDKLTDIYKLEVDTNGLWVNRIAYNPDGEITGRGPKIIRDKNGVALELSILKKDGSVNYNNKYYYDKNGLPINIHRTISQGKTVSEDFKREYEFDENGNWIKQIQYGPPAGNIFIIERSFEFYEKRSEIELLESELSKCVGKYELNSSFSITIIKEGNKIFAQGTDQDKFEIYAYDKYKFFTKEFTAEFIFLLNSKNEVTGFTLVQNGEYELKKVE